jgi:hypothetical protein
MALEHKEGHSTTLINRLPLTPVFTAEIPCTLRLETTTVIYYPSIFQHTSLGIVKMQSSFATTPLFFGLNKQSMLTINAANGSQSFPYRCFMANFQLPI